MRPTIIHSMKEYLPLTHQWIYETIQILATRFRQVIRTSRWIEGSPLVAGVEVIRDRPTLWRRWWIRHVGKDWWGRWRLPTNALLFSHFGPQGYHDLSLGIHPHWVRFYGFDISALPQRQPQWLPLYEQLFQQADVLVVEGPSMKVALAEAGAPTHKICVLPIGIRPPTYQIIRKWISPPLKVLLPHAIREKKGVLYAIRGLGIWHRRFGIDLEIHLVGDPPSSFDRPYWQQVCEEIRRWQLERYLIHYGFVSFERLLEVARECHVAIHASLTTNDGDTEGGYPHVIPTLMATGLPFIASHHADIPFVIQDGSGWLVPEKNAEAVADALNHAIGPGLELRSEQAAVRAKWFYWERLAPMYWQAMS